VNVLLQGQAISVGTVLLAPSTKDFPSSSGRASRPFPVQIAL